MHAGESSFEREVAVEDRISCSVGEVLAEVDPARFRALEWNFSSVGRDEGSALSSTPTHRCRAHRDQRSATGALSKRADVKDVKAELVCSTPARVGR